MKRDAQHLESGPHRPCADAGTSDQIVVIGGGPAGLVCAYLLAKRGFNVRLVERRSVPPAHPLPQCGHVHNLLLSSYYAVCQAIPELEGSLEAVGGVRVDWNAEFRRATPQGVAAESRSRNRVIVATRQKWDEALWKLLSDHTSVVVEHARVVGFGRSQDSEQIHVLTSNSESEPTREISAALVIDASGRARVSARYLIGAGFNIPTQTIETPMEYQSVKFRRRAGAATGSADILRGRPRAAVEVCTTEDAELRGAMGLPDGEDAFLVSAVSSTRRELRQFAESPEAWLSDLPEQLVSELVAGFEPVLGSGRRFAWSNNDIVRLDQLTGEVPVIALGDALSSTAPILGLGMSRAIEDAVYVAQELSRTDVTYRIDAIRKTLHRSAARDFRLAESLALELRVRETLSWRQRTVAWLRDRFLKAATRDAVLHQAYIDRRNRLVPAWHLLRPGVSMRFAFDILRHALPWSR